MLEINTHGKKVRYNTLADYGFIQNGEDWRYTCILEEVNLTATIILSDGRLYSLLTDSFSGEEYVLHRVSYASGTFVGAVREHHGRLIDSIIQKCFDTDIFREKQSEEIIDYVRDRYSNEPEYPWDDDNAIWRRDDNGKWYAALLNVSKTSLGLDGEGKAEVINLKAPPDVVSELIQKDGILRAYHMNKKHWFTVVLDGRVSSEEIFSLIDKSYETVGKKNKETLKTQI